MINKIATICVFVAFATGTTHVEAQVTSGNPQDSPYITKNSPYSIENSPYNPKNSEFHPDNSRFGDNVIRDSEMGESIGYFVRKDDGGVNFYSYSTEDEEGGRIGYISGDPDFDDF